MWAPFHGSGLWYAWCELRLPPVVRRNAVWQDVAVGEDVAVRLAEASPEHRTDEQLLDGEAAEELCEGGRVCVLVAYSLGAQQVPCSGKTGCGRVLAPHVEVRDGQPRYPAKADAADVAVESCHSGSEHPS